MHGKDKDWRDMDGLIGRVDLAGARRVEVDQKVGLNSVQSTSYPSHAVRINVTGTRSGTAA